MIGTKNDNNLPEIASKKLICISAKISIIHMITFPATYKQKQTRLFIITQCGRRENLLPGVKGINVGLRMLAGTCIGDVAVYPGRAGRCSPCGDGSKGEQKNGFVPLGRAVIGEGSVGVMAIT